MIRRTLLLLAMAVFGGGALNASFPDVPLDHWAYDAVEYLASKGYVQGYPDGEFKGDRELTRYEWALIVARLERDITMRYGAGGGGMPADAEGIMDDLREEFADELATLREMIAANEIRIEALAGDVEAMEEAVAALERRMDRMGSGGGGGGVNWYVDLGLMAHSESGDTSSNGSSFGVLNDAELALAGMLEVGATHRAGDWLFVFSLSSCPEMTGNIAQSSYDCVDMFYVEPGNQCCFSPAAYPFLSGPILHGPVTQFRRGGQWFNFSNSTMLGSNPFSPDPAFNLHELYTVWNGREGARRGVDVVAGRFEPFWAPSDFLWDSQRSVEGLAMTGMITDTVGFSAGFLTARHPVAGNDDPMVFLNLHTDNALQGIDLYFGYAEGQETDTGNPFDAPELWSAHLTFPFDIPGEDVQAEVFGGYIENANTDAPMDENAWEAGVRGPLNDWHAELAYRQIGLGAGHTGAWVPDTQFWSLDVTRDLGENVNFTLHGSWGTLGESNYFSDFSLDRWDIGAIVETTFP